jgi:hypothetical protein
VAVEKLFSWNFTNKIRSQDAAGKGRVFVFKVQQLP